MRNPPFRDSKCLLRPVAFFSSPISKSPSIALKDPPLDWTSPSIKQ